jgi:hypothetical protein
LILILSPKTLSHYSVVLVLQVAFLFKYFDKNNTLLIFLPLIVGTVYFVPQIGNILLANAYLFVFAIVISLIEIRIKSFQLGNSSKILETYI